MVIPKVTIGLLENHHPYSWTIREQEGFQGELAPGSHQGLTMRLDWEEPGWPLFSSA